MRKVRLPALLMMGWQGGVMGILGLSFFLVVGVGESFGQEGEVTITGREIVERLAGLEQGQKALEQRIGEVKSGLEQRIEDTRSSLEQQIKDTRSSLEQQIKDTRSSLEQQIKGTNRRIDDLRMSFSYLYMLLAAIIALNGAMVGSVIWMAIQERPVGKRHYEQIMAREEEIEREVQTLKREVESLKAQRA